MKNENTIELTVTLNLPDSLAREAEEKGLLVPQVLELLLRAEIRRRRINRLFNTADKLAALNMPVMTTAEIETEIQTARNLRRTYAGNLIHSKISGH